jgi:WD40 repeat protein
MSTTEDGGNLKNKSNKENINESQVESKVESNSITINNSEIEFSKEKNKNEIPLKSQTNTKKSDLERDLSFSDIYKTSSILKSSTSELLKNGDSFQSSKVNQEIQIAEERGPADLQGLSLDWCLGLNTSCLNNVQNLTTETTSNIFYTSGNTGILYDYNLNSQVLFQGHTDSISSVCYNQTRNIIVTADSGESCLMVVWDALKGVPLKTFFEPHENGVSVIDISPCGK